MFWGIEEDTDCVDFILHEVTSVFWGRKYARAWGLRNGNDVEYICSFRYTWLVERGKSKCLLFFFI